MLTKIDWISFSFPCKIFETTSFSETRKLIDHFIRLEIQEAADLFEFESWALSEQGRKPYNRSFESHLPGMKIWFSTKVPHATMEISGQGCDWLEKQEQIMRLLNMCQHRCTRLDIANDILTPTDPIEFAAERRPGRFKSAGQQVSESGTTVYIGSRTSDRYCKVYRYNEPHERAKLLRIEYTFKGNNAKLGAHDVLSSGHHAVALALGDTYGWKHPCYQAGGPTMMELSFYRPDRPTGKTLFWLADTVAPLLVRLHKEQQIDIHRWMEENVLSKLSDADSE